jgi:hypothetical protein
MDKALCEGNALRKAGERGVESGDERVAILARKGEWRFDLDNIVEWPVCGHLIT